MDAVGTAANDMRLEAAKPLDDPAAEDAPLPAAAPPLPLPLPAGKLVMVASVLRRSLLFIT
jgi:hypothetical protein